MKLIKLFRFLSIVIFFLSTLPLVSQTKGIIVDKETLQPIPYVCVYAKNGEAVLGAMSDENGQFSFDFSFRNLFFSHINYERTEIKKENLRDTIFMTPSSVLLSEVVVSNKQPQWIQRIVKEVVKQKNKNYQNTEKQFSYNYESMNVYLKSLTFI